MSDQEDIDELDATILDKEIEEENNFKLQLNESEAWEFGELDKTMSSDDELTMSETTHRKPKACFKGYYYTVDKPDGQNGNWTGKTNWKCEKTAVKKKNIIGCPGRLWTFVEGKPEDKLSSEIILNFAKPNLILVGSLSISKINK